VKTAKTILSVASLHIERGGTVILNEVNWRVQRGEHWVILGANGSGKTSLLSALTGYLMPTRGEISRARRNLRPVRLARTA
jgi:iron complex transport system ATP-binding protein